MPKAVFSRERINNHAVLVPMDEDGQLLLAAWKIGKRVMVDVHVPRNPGHHRLMFAIFKMLADAGVWEGDMDAFLDWAKYATGWVRVTIDHRGEAHTVPKSIAFESMDQTAFRDFFDRLMAAISERLLGGDGDNMRATAARLEQMLDQGYEELAAPTRRRALPPPDPAQR